MEDRFILKATVHEADDISLEAIAQKRDIVLPSEHIALFIATLAPLEDANQNGVRLSEEASRKFLTTINQAQVNFEHFGRGFICGAVIDGWIDEATRETKVAFTFHKMIYSDEYTRALGLMAENKLGVSFELLADRGSKEELSDGTVRLNDFTYTGMGFLLDNPPAYKNAQVLEFAQRIKDRVKKYSTKELVFANEIVATCDEILATDHLTDVDETPPMLFIVTTSDVEHFHVAEVDIDGNGKTITGHGDGKHPQPHIIVNWQIQVADNADPETGEHAHRILNEIMASIKEYISKKHLKRNVKKDKVKNKKLSEQKGGTESMKDEDTKKVTELREELGDFAKDVSDEDLLNEDKVTELRQAKSDSEKEAKKSKEESEEKKADEEEKDEDKKDEDKEDKDAKIAELEKENKELKATTEAKDSEIETVRENAEKIGKLKVELADNPHVKDFSDEDYLDEAKINQAKLQKENDDLKAERDELKKENESLIKANKDIKPEKEEHKGMDTGAKDTKDKSFDQIIKNNYDSSRIKTEKETKETKETKEAK